MIKTKHLQLLKIYEILLLQNWKNCELKMNMLKQSQRMKIKGNMPQSFATFSRAQETKF